MTAGSYGPEGGMPGAVPPERGDPLATTPTTTPDTSAGGTGGQVQEKARQAAGQVQEKAQQFAGPARERAREQVDQRSTQAGEQVRSTADAVRKTSEELRGQGQETPAKVLEQASQRIEGLGSYLVDADADKILRDIENFGRRQPWATAGVGALVGFVASRFLKASSSRRYESEYETRASWTAPARPGMEPVSGRPTVTADVDVAPTTPAPVGPTPPEAY